MPFVSGKNETKNPKCNQKHEKIRVINTEVKSVFRPIRVIESKRIEISKKSTLKSLTVQDKGESANIAMQLL